MFTPMRLYTLVAAIGALTAACAAPPPAAVAPEGALVVMTFNIHAGKDAAGQHNLERVAAVIRGAGADVVLLQEVDRMTRRSGGEDQLAQLAAHTGMHGAFGRTLDYQGGTYGIAILSRWPIARDTMHALPVDPPQERAGGSREPRGALHAIIALGVDTLHVLNTHLDPSGDDRWRRQEAAALAAIAAPLAARGAAVVLGGDLNALPGTAPVERVAAAGVTDWWTRCGEGPGFTYPDSLPARRIDYLMGSAAFRCVRAEVLPAGPSDHRALRVVLARRDRR